MGGIHACMVAALSQVPVACVAMLPPRSAAVAYCDGALSSFVDVRALHRSHALDSTGMPLVSAVVDAFARDDVFPNTPSMFAHLEAPSSRTSGQRTEQTMAQRVARHSNAVVRAKKNSMDWLPALGGGGESEAEPSASQIAAPPPRSASQRVLWLKALLPQLPNVTPLLRSNQLSRWRQLSSPRALTRASGAVRSLAARMRPRSLWRQQGTSARPLAKGTDLNTSSLPYDDVANQVDNPPPGQAAALQRLSRRFMAALLPLTRLSARQQVRDFPINTCNCSSKLCLVRAGMGLHHQSGIAYRLRRVAGAASSHRCRT